MGPVDYIIIIVIAAVLGLAGWFVYRSKKQGHKCIGCPDSSKCSGNCAGCACGQSSENKK